MTASSTEEKLYCASSLAYSSTLGRIRLRTGIFFNLGYKFLRPSYNPNADGNEVEAEVKEDTKEEKKDKKKDEKKIVLKKEDVGRRNRYKRKYFTKNRR